jgi:hypothetical protein
MPLTIELLKEQIAATYDVKPYFEWSEAIDQELMLTAWLYNLNPWEMYWC